MKNKSLLVGMVMLWLVGGRSWTEGSAWAQVGHCAGDCNHDSRVSIAELVIGVNMALGTVPADRCPEFESAGHTDVTIAQLIAAVNNALAGCGSQANRAPQASDLSFGAGAALPYLEKQLIGSDPDYDTITYELIADDAGDGYTFAYLNPESGALYVTLAADFHGTIVLPYHVTDGKLFSDTANVTIDVGDTLPSGSGGVQPVEPREYASNPRGFYYGSVLGAPGGAPTLPSWVDLSSDYPLPGNQGQQSSCVAWSLGYAIKSYQERLELGWSLEAPQHLFSPAYMYNQLNHGRDAGLIYNEALNFIVDEGFATLARMPYNEHDFWTQPSLAARQEAAHFKAKSWKIANGVLDAKAALANHLPVFMIIQLISDIHGLRGPDSVYNTFNGVFEIGHGVAAVGYDDDRYGGAFKIMNSWGQNWGDGGYFWMPYWTTNYMVNTDLGVQPVLTAAIVVEDLPDDVIPDPDPVDPPLPAELPDLQVTDWRATYNGMPGGSGSLQYTVTNTGIATAPAGAHVALILSRDPTFQWGNTLVVYEPIPFELAPGGTAYRDENHRIAFNFPSDLEPGEYYMAVWADIWDGVVESNENNNISPAMSTVDVVNTLPDMGIVSWYAAWDELGIGSLIYNLVNNGGSIAYAGWQIALALSPNDVIGDGDEIVLLSEQTQLNVDAGGTLYRTDASAIGFNLYFDQFGNQVPDGVYYLALWLDPYGFLAESNEYNNASLSWGTIGVGGFGLAATSHRAIASTTATGLPIAGEAYNGKALPAREGSVRMVRIGTTKNGARQMEPLGPRVQAAEPDGLSKVAQARQQVIFPATEMKAMPGGH